jgi:predicted PurR-regulated permease PerM
MALVAITSLALYLCWKLLQPFLSVLLWASVLALLFRPLTRLLERKLPPSVAASFTLLLVLLAVIVPVGLLSLALSRELVNFAQAAPEKVRRLLDDSGLATSLQTLATRFGLEVDLPALLRREPLEEHLSEWGQRLARSTFSVLGGFFGALVQLAFILFTLFFLLRDGPSLAKAVRGFIPLEDRDTDHLFSRMESVVRASVLGVLAIATVQGLLGGLAFAVLGLPSPLLWGTIMTILAILPLVGTGLVWGPAALLLAFEGRYLAAAALALFGLLVIGSVDNFLRPRLVGQRTQMHELVIFFSVLGGLRVFGMLGIVLGPVVVAGTLVLFEAFRSSSLWSSERRSV